MKDVSDSYCKKQMYQCLGPVEHLKLPQRVFNFCSGGATPPPRHGCGGSSENIYLLPALLCPDIFLGIWTFVVRAAIARAGGTRLQQTDTSVPVLRCRQEKPQGYPLLCLPATTLPPQRSLPTLAERLQEFTKGLISILSDLCIGAVSTLVPYT